MMSYKEIKILVANRGEIAVRIFKTLKKMGIVPVAVFAPFENKAYHAGFAPEAYELKGESVTDTYLNKQQIINIAILSGCKAIHPGYGFLSENADFARMCENNHIIFIGPRSETIRAMGDKMMARNLAAGLNIPVIKEFGLEAPYLPEEKDFPVLIKAAHGGGGRGMRIVQSMKGFQEALSQARGESGKFFGNESVFIESYINNPRHIEVQVLGDNYGNIVHLFDRECSIQRRFQKIIEEAPVVSITAKTRAKIFEYALKLTNAIGYNNAGTVEFLVDRDENVFFLEVNTRIQVEHPVTELVTGIDIVRQQVQVALGNKLELSQDEIKVSGHAIEARICAEGPGPDFNPSSGCISLYKQPVVSGIRVDTGIGLLNEVGPWFDPMLAKIIAFGSNRDEAIRKITAYLREFQVHGVSVNSPYLLNIMEHDKFMHNELSTSFINQHQDELNALAHGPGKEILAAALFFYRRLRFSEGKSAFDGGWRLYYTLDIDIDGLFSKFFINLPNHNTLQIFHNQGTFEIHLEAIEQDAINIVCEDKRFRLYLSDNGKGAYYISCNGLMFRLTVPDEKPYVAEIGPGKKGGGNNQVISPLHGKVTKINVAVNKKVKQGDLLIVIESMKIENNIYAGNDGKVQSIEIKQGEQVYPDKLLMLIG